MRSPTLRRPLSVFNGRHVVQRAVRADMVVLSPPQVDFDPRFVHGPKPLAVKTFVTELAIQTLHKRVLSRFAGLDKAQCHPGFFAPEEHRLACELCPVVADDLSRRASFLAQLGHYSSCWIFSCLILSRVEASTKPGVIHFDYVKVFYNRKRRHSHLGGLSPEAFEAASA